MTIEWDAGKFIRAEYLTYKKVFPHVYLFPVRTAEPAAVQNIILVAAKNPVAPELTSSDPELSRYLKMRFTGELAEDVPVLTDDFAPVDQYISALL